MEQLDIAYFAGFVDGEGTIAINKHGIRKNGKIRLEVCLSVCNTNEKIISDILKYFFCGNISVDTRKHRKKPLWQWRIVDIKAKQIIKKLYPFLRIKKQNAKLILDFPLAENGKLGSSGYSNLENKKRHKIYEILKELNRK